MDNPAVNRMFSPDGALMVALLLSPIAAFAQAIPEVANAAKASKHAWESAPGERQVLWQARRESSTHIDISEDTQRQVIIARRPPELGAYPKALRTRQRRRGFSGAGADGTKLQRPDAPPHLESDSHPGRSRKCRAHHGQRGFGGDQFQNPGPRALDVERCP
jgi:hypothetical protein